MNKLSSKQQYEKLVADIEAIEKANNNIYLFDECVALQSASFKSTNCMTDEQYNELHNIVASHAGSRAEDLGLNLNSLLGYSVY